MGNIHLWPLLRRQWEGFPGHLVSSTASKYHNASAPHCTVGTHQSLGALENGVVPGKEFPFPALHPQLDGWWGQKECGSFGCVDGRGTAVSDSPPGAEAHSHRRRETQWNLTKEKPKTYHIFSIKKWGFVPAFPDSLSQDAHCSCVSGGAGPQLQESH